MPIKSRKISQNFEQNDDSFFITEEIIHSNSPILQKMRDVTKIIEKSQEKAFLFNNEYNLFNEKPIQKSPRRTAFLLLKNKPKYAQKCNIKVTKPILLKNAKSQQNIKKNISEIFDYGRTKVLLAKNAKITGPIINFECKKLENNSSFKFLRQRSKSMLKVYSLNSACFNKPRKLQKNISISHITDISAISTKIAMNKISESQSRNSIINFHKSSFNEKQTLTRNTNLLSPATVFTKESPIKTEYKIKPNSINCSIFNPKKTKCTISGLLFFNKNKL